jgi:hypothetical protein
VPVSVRILALCEQTCSGKTSRRQEQKRQDSKSNLCQTGSQLGHWYAHQHFYVFPVVTLASGLTRKHYPDRRKEVRKEQPNNQEGTKKDDKSHRIEVLRALYRYSIGAYGASLCVTDPIQKSRLAVDIIHNYRMGIRKSPHCPSGQATPRNCKNVEIPES